MSTLTLSFILVAYLFGSVSTAILVCKAFGLPDPRKQGSNNPGATNVLRLGGKVPAMITLFGDAFKCVIPVVIGHFYVPFEFLGYVAFAAFLGHLFPVFFKFQGGKGVATFLGAMFALYWPLGLWFVGLWFVIAATTRYSSLAALVATLAMPIVVWQQGLQSLIIPLSLMAVLIIIRHKANIQRLVKGNESKIGKSAKA